jgi:hypothetical protein
MSGNLSTKHMSGPSPYERGQETGDRSQEHPTGERVKILETRARRGFTRQNSFARREHRKSMPA